MFEYKNRRGTIQYTQFSLIGIINGAIDLGALNLLLLTWPTHDEWSLFGYNSFAYILAVLSSYFWNSRLTFRNNVFFTKREKGLFVFQAAISLFISNGVFLLFIYWFQFISMPLWMIHNGAKGISMFLSSNSSFFLMKYLVFKKNRKESN